MGRGFRSWIGLASMVLAVAVAGCGLSSSPSSSSGGKVRVVAAENFWGSIATQIGGDHAQVTSIIVNPDTDPHAYEATPGDARTIAQAQYVIANGAGYDPWVPKFLDANPVSGRKVMTVADLFGKKEGDNPHMWYSPSYVDQVVDRIASDLAAIDSNDASYFQSQGSQFKSVGLKAYHDTINTIKNKYSGTKVGASESIFSYLADGLGLDLITPYEYLKAISEGTDPTAADKATAQAQISSKQIKVFVFNSQNSTPDVQSLVDLARSKGIAVTTVTETLSPATATFQDWQTGQLQDLLKALGG
jgi:zinc/manganese transport system substrate-binding protein